MKGLSYEPNNEIDFEDSEEDVPEPDAIDKESAASFKKLS